MTWEELCQQCRWNCCSKSSLPPLKVWIFLLRYRRDFLVRFCSKNSWSICTRTPGCWRGFDWTRLSHWSVIFTLNCHIINCVNEITSPFMTATIFLIKKDVCNDYQLMNFIFKNWWIVNWGSREKIWRTNPRQFWVDIKRK